MAEIRLTAEGVRKYEEELEYLKTTGRLEVAEEIKVARSFGDLSENAEYDAAKDKQARMEYRIAELETILRNVVLIDEENLDTNVVNVGTNVKIRDLNRREEIELRIVGSAESEPKSWRISNESPVGKGLLGHSVGDIVDVHAPGGNLRFEILAIGK